MAESNTGLGSVSFLINVAPGEVVGDATLEDAGNVVAAMFAEGLKRHGLDEIFVIEAVECRRGCIIIEVVIGGSIVIGGGGGAALLVLRDYDKYRNNLIQVVKDLNGAWVRLKKLGERRLWLFRHELPRIDAQLAPIPPDDIQ